MCKLNPFSSLPGNLFICDNITSPRQDPGSAQAGSQLAGKCFLTRTHLLLCAVQLYVVGCGLAGIPVSPGKFQGKFLHMNRALGPVYMVAKTVGFPYMPGNSAGRETRLAGKLASL